MSDGGAQIRTLLKETALRRVQSKEEYYAALDLAREEKWSNVRIAKVVGVSEAAIRQHFKRLDAKTTKR